MGVLDLYFVFLLGQANQVCGQNFFCYVICYYIICYYIFNKFNDL